MGKSALIAGLMTGIAAFAGDSNTVTFNSDVFPDFAEELPELP